MEVDRFLADRGWQLEPDAPARDETAFPRYAAPDFPDQQPTPRSLVLSEQASGACVDDTALSHRWSS